MSKNDKPSGPANAPTSTTAPKKEPAPPKDVALVLGATEDGSKVATLRQRGERVEAAVLSRIDEGKPIHGEVVQLKARQEPHLYDVETLVDAPSRPDSSGRPASTGRPAQVASDRYRAGWGRVFGSTKRKRPLN